GKNRLKNGCTGRDYTITGAVIDRTNSASGSTEILFFAVRPIQAFEESVDRITQFVDLSAHALDDLPGAILRIHNHGLRLPQLIEAFIPGMILDFESDFKFVHPLREAVDALREAVDALRRCLKVGFDPFESFFGGHEYMMPHSHKKAQKRKRLL